MDTHRGGDVFEKFRLRKSYDTARLTIGKLENLKMPSIKITKKKDEFAKIERVI